MVNQNLDKFTDVANKHKSPHLGGDTSGDERISETDRSHSRGINEGAEGRTNTKSD
ncbi:hypothetical protein [Anaerobacillus alkalilacustris]|uniref:hypothetical protein n=1 Tax=Anaerobacillus alkalilacustris TaxID=393763 RepID=UPI0014713E59|nr:hypothetical protein [Anaerobacillus alkalilacustris]